MLKRPNYIEEQDGGISKIFCQVCGEQIAGIVEAPVGSGPYANRLMSKFKRFPNYVEIKIEFDDHTFHVTNGCKHCLKLNMPVELLQEIYEADMQVMQMYPGSRKPVQVIGIDMTGVGLI